MFRNLANALINLYQITFSSSVPTCRYQPTCSEYAHSAINKYGVTKGSILAAKRILSCHPFSNRHIYDPVP